jgi:hypothetical protein
MPALLHNQCYGATASPQPHDKGGPVTTGKYLFTEPVSVEDLGFFRYKKLIAFGLSQSSCALKVTYNRDLVNELPPPHSTSHA